MFGSLNTTNIIIPLNFFKVLDTNVLYNFNILFYILQFQVIQCDICGKFGFRSEEQLESHMKTKHGELNPIVLIRHPDEVPAMTKTGERPAKRRVEEKGPVAKKFRSDVEMVSVNIFNSV